MKKFFLTLAIACDSPVHRQLESEIINQYGLL